MPKPADHADWSEILWPDEKSGPWYFRANWVDVDGWPECVGLVIWKGVQQDPHEVTAYRPIRGVEPQQIAAAEVRQLPIGAILGELRRDAASFEERIDSMFQDAGGPPLGRTFPPLEKKKPGRRPIYDLDHFRDVAKVYLAALGIEPPTLAVAKRFHVSRSAAAKWVARARAEGFLGDAEYGKAGRGHAPTPQRGKHRKGKP